MLLVRTPAVAVSTWLAEALVEARVLSGDVNAVRGLSSSKVYK